MSNTATNTRVRKGIERLSPAPHGGQIFAYLRVSTDSQELDSQKVGIVDYATNHHFGPIHFVEEKASGSVPASERTLGKELLPTLKAGDSLVVSEISRLGRSLVDILGTLKVLAEKAVQVHVVKSGCVFDDSINSKIISTVLGLAAEIERDLLRQRVKEGQARARAAGKKLGRPKAEVHSSKLDKHAEVIKTYASRGMSKLNLARAFDCDWTTMNRWLERNNVKVARRSA